MSSMRIYLDSSAWVSLIKDCSSLELVLTCHKRGLIEVTLSMENIRELIIKDSVGETFRTKNLFAVLPLLGNFQSDSLFVLDHSRLGFANLSSKRISNVFGSHLNGKSKPEKARADGIHIATAVANEAEFVCCDHQARISALGQVQKLHCLRQLVDELGGSVAGLDDCSCPLFTNRL